LNVSETYQSISACITACGYLLCRNAPIPKALIATDMVGESIGALMMPILNWASCDMTQIKYY